MSYCGLERGQSSASLKLMMMILLDNLETNFTILQQGFSKIVHPVHDPVAHIILASHHADLGGME